MVYRGTSQFAFLCLVLLSAIGCDRSSQPVEDRAVSVRVMRPVVREVTDYAYFTGRTAAVESVNVQSRVTGYLDSVDFKSGAMVKTGTRLFKIDPRPYQAALDRADSRVQLAEARLGLAKANYQRALEVAKTPGAISRQDIDRYAAAQAEAQASVAAAQADSESSRLDVEFTDILSPINGIVGRNLLDIGNLVKQDFSLLTTVVSQDPMYVYFDVDEQTMLRVQRMMGRDGVNPPQKGGVFEVHVGLADEGDRYPHKGRIDFVNNQMGISTATIQVRAKIPNPPMRKGSIPLLTPGLFVRVRLPVSLPHKALLVPQSTLCTDQGDKYLLVVDRNNIVRRRPVTPGPEQADQLQVVIPEKMVSTKDGLRVASNGDKGKKTVNSITSSDRIIKGGLQRVRPGTRVEARGAATAAKKPSQTGPRPSPSEGRDSASEKPAPKSGN